MTSVEQSAFTKLENLERKPCLPAINHGSLTEEIETFEGNEMTILCLKCRNYLNLNYLQEHRSFHDALSLFQYDIDSKPRNTKQLTCQRSHLIKNLTQTNVSPSEYYKELSKIDLAYEILKSDMCGRSNKPRMNINDFIEVKIRSYNTKLNARTSMGVCQTCNEKWKSVMEDSYSFKTDLVSGVFFAVFDGYNGQTAARYCAKNLHCILKEHIAVGDTQSGIHCDVGNCEMAKPLQKTYEDMDKMLLFGEEETSRNRWSGCSSTSAVLSEKHLHVANVGNVKGICIKSDMTIQTLTEDHTTDNKKERKRLKKLVDINTWLKTIWTSGVALTTRGLGNHGDPFLKASLVNVPGCSCVVLDDDDQYIILLGSGGFWEVFDENEVLVLLQDWLEIKEIEIGGGDDGSVNETWENLDNAKFNDDNIITEQLPSNEAGVTEIVVSNSEELNTGANENENKDKTDLTIEKTTDGIGEDNDVLSDTLSKEMSKHSEHLFSNLLKNIMAQLDSCEICQEISKYLVSAALNGGAKSNVTVMVVLINKKIVV